MAATERRFPVQETIDRLYAIYEIFGEERQQALLDTVDKSLLHLAPSDVKSAEWGIVPGQRLAAARCFRLVAFSARLVLWSAFRQKMIRRRCE